MLTVSGRPFIGWLLSASMAAFASASLGISTNPNPRLRPVSRSVTTWARFTAPYCWNIANSSSVVVDQGKLPT